MSLLALHNRANVDPSAAEPWFRNFFDSVLVKRDFSAIKSAAFMELYTEAYRFFVTGHWQQTHLLQTAIADAIACHREQIADAAVAVFPHSPRAFAAIYCKAWNNFCADINIIQTVCKYASQKFQDWRIIFEAENVVALWENAVLTDPAISAAIRQLLWDAAQLQHQAFHVLKSSAKEGNAKSEEALAELRGSFVEESATSGISGCKQCLQECGILGAVQASATPTGVLRAIHPSENSLKK